MADGCTLDTTDNDLSTLVKDDEPTHSTWGKLNSLEAATAPNVDLTADSITFGRSKELPAECQFNDKRISLKHCRIWREEQQDDLAKIWIEDSSSNGTFVNGVKVGKGKKVQLHHGDEIGLATTTAQTTNIRYLFQNAEILKTRKDSLSQSADVPASNSSSSSSSSSSGVTKGPSFTSTTTDNGTKEEEIAPAKRKLERSDSMEKKRAKLEKLEEIYEDNLICGICHELLYKCVTVIPCLHNFCAACLSSWFERSKVCPSCRDESQGIRKNHAINNLVESYLEANPEKKRDPEELKEMDEKNKITEEMLRPQALKKKRRDYSSEGDEDEDDEDGSEDDEAPPPFAFGPAVGFVPAFNNNCRQCTNPGPDGFQCPPIGAIHIFCTRCNERIPNRAAYPNPVRCQMCSAVFCDLYWGCKNALGQGALKPAKNYTFANLPIGALNGNGFEKQVLQNWMDSKGKSPTTIFTEITAGLDSGKFTYTAPLTGHGVKGDSHLCSNCAGTLFTNTIYDYRAAIPIEQFPDSVKRRHPCHFGKHCRTQKHNEDHTKRYNHICEQTKF